MGRSCTDICESYDTERKITSGNGILQVKTTSLRTISLILLRVSSIILYCGILDGRWKKVVYAMYSVYGTIVGRFVDNNIPNSVIILYILVVFCC